jgi:hypothetical protein
MTAGAHALATTKCRLRRGVSDLTWLTIRMWRLVQGADLGVRGSEPLILHTNRGS